MMGGLGKAFGRLLGVKKVRVPDVTAPPEPVKIDDVDRSALLAQRERRNITAQGERSLLGTGESERTNASLLQNVDRTSAGLVERNTLRTETASKAEAERKRLAALKLTRGAIGGNLGSTI